MSHLRAAFPWLLLTASLALNIHLWRDRPSRSVLPHRPHESYKTYSEIPLTAAPAASYQRPTPPNAPPPTPSPPRSALQSTASRSAAFAGYADLLAEDIKTQEQIDALNQLLARWVATDPAAAATWLGQYDQAPFYDPAARHIALHLVARQNFREASTWADLIRDPALREDAREALVAESFRAKKIDATAVRLSGLPPARIEAILSGGRLD